MMTTTKKLLDAREIEALENTSFASAFANGALGDGGADAAAAESDNLSACVSNGSCSTGAVCISNGSCNSGVVCASNGTCVTFGVCNSNDCTALGVCVFWTNNAAICGIVASAGCTNIVSSVITVVVSVACGSAVCGSAVCDISDNCTNVSNPCSITSSCELTDYLDNGAAKDTPSAADAELIELVRQA